MYFGHNNQRHDCHLDDHTLEKIDNQKDLGVIIDNNLKFHIHSASASKKANQL